MKPVTQMLRAYTEPTASYEKKPRKEKSEFEKQLEDMEEVRRFAHFKLSCSRAFILRAYPQQTHEMLFDAHNHVFRVFAGVPRRGIYDNMLAAVDKVGRGKERQVNARFSAMVSHFLFEAEFCNPASGWEKRQIEKNVQDARHRLWQPEPNFPSLAALND